MDKILFVDESYAHQISELRKKEYTNASGLNVGPETLKWRETDNNSFIMASTSNDQITSTMRGEILTDKKLLEYKIECPWDFDVVLQYPVLLLSRAATSSAFRSQGLNLLLRYWFLKFAKHHKISHVIGTFVSGSPREQTLRELGYQFFINEQGWQQSTFRSLGPVWVVVLDMHNDGNQAIKICEEQIPHLIEKYEFKDPFPELKNQND